MTPEKSLEIVCCKMLERLGGIARKFGNYNHGKYKNKKGTFDYLMSLNKRLFWVEFKIKPRKPTKEQKEFQSWICNNYGNAYVCYDIKGFEKILLYIFSL